MSDNVRRLTFVTRPQCWVGAEAHDPLNRPWLAMEGSGKGCGRTWTPHDVAQACLLEVGRGDLALMIEVQNDRLGFPKIRDVETATQICNADRQIVIMAFYLAHRSAHSEARLDRDGDKLYGITCPTCHPELAD